MIKSSFVQTAKEEADAPAIGVPLSGGPEDELRACVIATTIKPILKIETQLPGYNTI